MSDNPIINFLKCLVGYFMGMLICTWIAEKILWDFSQMGIFLVQGHFLKGIILAAVAYFIYFFCALLTASEGESGKFTIAIIIIFSLFSMYNEIDDFAGKSEGIEFVGSALFYVIAMLNDTLRIIATLHAFKDVS